MLGFTARIVALGGLAACAASVPLPASQSSVADLQLPEEWGHAVEFSIPDSAARTADAHAHYMQAIFEEESEGPDKSISSKESVLRHDPGFSALAIDVARHHLGRGNVAEALSVLKDAATANPRDTSPLMALSTIYLRHLEKPSLAEKYALRLHKTDPQNTDTIALLCDIYRAGGKSSRIEPLLDSSAKSNSTDPAYWIALAEIRLRELSQSRRPPSDKNRTSVADLAHKALELADADPKILAAAGDVFALLGNPLEAIDAYRAAMATDPERDGVREKLANCLIETGNAEAALGLLEEIVAGNPLNLAAYDQLARIHLGKKNYPLAVANMRQAMRLAPVDPVRFEEIVRAALLAEDHATAVQFANEAEQRFPHLAGFTILRAVALSQSGDHHAALAAFERALVVAANANPEILNSDFYLSYGAAAERAGHYIKAADLLKKSIALDPDGSAEACNHLGYMWADRNEHLDEAEALIRRALELDPSNPAYRDSLGWVFFRQGRFEEALTELQRAASGTGTPDPVILEHVGDTLLKLDRSAEALQYWQKALQITPSNAALASKIDNLVRPLARQPEPTR